MALTFHPAVLTVDQIKDLVAMPSFNRIALQHYTTNGKDFDLVAQAMSPARSKIGPPVIYLKRGAGNPVTNSRDFVFGQYELTAVQIKKLSKDFNQDIIFTPKMSEINPESTEYDTNGQQLDPSPPAPPPNP